MSVAQRNHAAGRSSLATSGLCSVSDGTRIDGTWWSPGMVVPLAQVLELACTSAAAAARCARRSAGRVPEDVCTRLWRQWEHDPAAFVLDTPRDAERGADHRALARVVVEVMAPSPIALEAAKEEAEAGEGAGQVAEAPAAVSAAVPTLGYVGLFLTPSSRERLLQHVLPVRSPVVGAGRRGFKGRRFAPHQQSQVRGIALGWSQDGAPKTTRCVVQLLNRHVASHSC